MKRIQWEILRSNEQLVKAGYDDFEKNPYWSPRMIAIELADSFEAIGLPRRMAHGITVTKQPTFIEWDSGNPSHAVGYWLIEIEVSEGLHKLIERACAGED